MGEDELSLELSFGIGTLALAHAAQESGVTTIPVHAAARSRGDRSSA